MKKQRGRQLATQVIIEPHFGADFLSLFTNGINHISCQKTTEVLPSYRIRGIENWKPNHWFSMYFDLCGYEGYASYSMIYGEAQRGECTVILMIIFKNSSRGFLPRTLAASALNQRVVSNKSNPEGNGRMGTLSCRLRLSSTLERI